MPAIRHLCTQMEALAAPHHIFAGVSSILASQERQSVVKIQALLVAVYILVTTRLTGTETAPSEYQARKNLALKIVMDASRQDEAHTEVGNADIDECMREVKKHKWTQMDWFRNIPLGAGIDLDSGVGHNVEDRSHSEEAEEEDLLPTTRRVIGSRKSPERDYLQAGLGTMVKTCPSSCVVVQMANVCVDARSGGLPQ